MKRAEQQLTWDDFPVRQEADGWHCRFCGKLLAGRRSSWCSRECEKEVLLRVHWPYIRACILRRDRRRCQMCGEWASEVDHIIELADGGSFHDWGNLRSLCKRCHSAKSAAMRTARALRKRAERAGQAVLPLDGPAPRKEPHGKLQLLEDQDRN